MSKMYDVYKAQYEAEQKIIAEGPPPSFDAIRQRWIGRKVSSIRETLEDLDVSEPEIARVCDHWRREYEEGRGNAYEAIADEYRSEINDYAQTVIAYGSEAAAEKARALIDD